MPGLRVRNGHQETRRYIPASPRGDSKLHAVAVLAVLSRRHTERQAQSESVFAAEGLFELNLN